MLSQVQVGGGHGHNCSGAHRQHPQLCSIGNRLEACCKLAAATTWLLTSTGSIGAVACRQHKQQGAKQVT